MKTQISVGGVHGPAKGVSSQNCSLLSGSMLICRGVFAPAHVRGPVIDRFDFQRHPMACTKRPSRV